jgi:hypothetical protein
LNNHTRSFGPWAWAIVFITPRPTAVPPVIAAVARRNSRREIWWASSCSASWRTRLSMRFSLEGTNTVGA